MIVRRPFYSLLALLCASPLHAQAVLQSGAVTAYHPSVWSRNGVIADGGTVTAPAINQLGLFGGTNCPLGVSSQTGIGSVATAHSLLTICQTDTTTTFKVRGLNGASTPNVVFDVGGTTYPFPQTSIGLTVGTTTITSGGSGNILYDNAGILGELTPTGTGSIILSNGPTITSPTLVTPALGTPASGVATNLTGTAASLTAGHVTTNANLTGPITSSGNATAIGAQTGTGSTFVMQASPAITTPALSGPTVSTAATVTAGTNAQGQGALTSDNNVITTAAASPSGATLPTATTGRIVTIANEGANTVNVFPASGGTIDGLSANASIALPSTNVMTFYAASTTHWYSTYQLWTAVASGSGTVTSVGLSGGSTGLTVSGSPVTTTGTLTLSGGVLVAANGGTSCSVATITCFNNITGLSAAGTTGTTSTNLVFSTSPTLTTPTVSGALTYGGVTLTANVTGTGKMVLDTAPTLSAPVIGTITNTGTLTLPTSTDTLVGRATTDTLTNKRITPRIGTTASGSTITPTGDASDQYNVTALAADATIAAPSGTPTDGQRLILRILDNGTARALTWNAAYRAVGVTLPTTTVISKVLYVGFIWSSQNSTWDCVAVAQQS